MEGQYFTKCVKLWENGDKELALKTFLATQSEMIMALLGGYWWEEGRIQMLFHKKEHEFYLSCNFYKCC